MKKLYSTFMIMALILVCTTARADDIFVYDDGTQLTISWSVVTGAFYYEVALVNLTNESTTYEERAFDPFIVINGLVYHNIYKITVKAYDNGGAETDVGETYITFALDQTSGNCNCVCNCPDVPKQVFYGLIAEGWWTFITINNASNESQPVIIKAGTSSKTCIVPSNSVESFFLHDLLDVSIEPTTFKEYPITYETDCSDVGVTVVAGIQNSFGFQN